MLTNEMDCPNRRCAPMRGNQNFLSRSKTQTNKLKKTYPNRAGHQWHMACFASMSPLWISTFTVFCQQKRNGSDFFNFSIFFLFVISVHFASVFWSFTIKQIIELRLTHFLIGFNRSPRLPSLIRSLVFRLQNMNIKYQMIRVADQMCMYIYIVCHVSRRRIGCARIRSMGHFGTWTLTSIIIIIIGRWWRARWGDHDSESMHRHTHTHSTQPGADTIKCESKMSAIFVHEHLGGILKQQHWQNGWTNQRPNQWMDEKKKSANQQMNCNVHEFTISQ